MKTKSLFKNNKFGYTLVEIIATITIVAAVILIAIKFISDIDKQKIFDLKYEKVSAVMQANIEKNMLSHTGTKYEEDFVQNNLNYQEILTENMDAKRCVPNDACWFQLPTDVNGFDLTDAAVSTYKMQDDTFIAIQNDDNGTRVFVDVNGKNSPNKFGKDIYEFIYVPRKNS